MAACNASEPGPFNNRSHLSHPEPDIYATSIQSFKSSPHPIPQSIRKHLATPFTSAMSRSPFSGFGIPGSNPRPPAGGQQPPQRAPYGSDPYQQSQQGYGGPRYNDPRQQQPSQSGGYGGQYSGGGYSEPQRSPRQSRHNEKPPGSAPGSGRQVSLRVEKVADRTLQSRLIYGNLYVPVP